MKQGESLPISNIRLDGGTQPRATIDFEAVVDYMAAMAGGAIFPPVVVFYDGANYWLADGFHRVKAAEQSGVENIACDLRQGTQQDAQWYSFGANKATGLRRTNEDKQRAVKAALLHSNGVQLSNRRIAAHVGVDEGTVRGWRERLTAEIPQSSTRTGLDGRTTEVSNIGTAVRATKSTSVPTRFRRAPNTPQAHQTDSPPPVAASDATDLAEQALPVSGRATRAQRIDRLTRSTLTFIEATKHLAHLVGWLGEAVGEFDEAELLLRKATDAIAAASTEIERKALAADPLNASRLEIQEELK